MLANLKVNKYDREYPRLTGRAGDMEEKTIKHWTAYRINVHSKT